MDDFDVFAQSTESPTFAAGSASAGVGMKSPSTQVEQELVRLATEISGLHEQIVELEGRLYIVLRETEPEPDEPNVASPEMVVVPLAETVRGANRGIWNATRRLRLIAERLEL